MSKVPGSEGEEPRDKVSNWLKESRTNYIRLLATNFSHTDLRIQVVTF